MAQGSHRFREELRRALPQWQADGLVSPDAAAALHARYALGEVEAGAGVLPVYVLGALLVGAGIASLAAYHWEALSVQAQVALLAAAVAACHGGGTWLWRRSGQRHLGHALTLLGTTAFGVLVSLHALTPAFDAAFADGWPWRLVVVAAGALVAGLLHRSLPHLFAAALLGAAGTALLVRPTEHAGAQAVAVAWALATLLLVGAWRSRSRALAVAAPLALAGTLLGLVELTPALLGAACVGALLASAPLAAAPLSARGDTGALLAGALRVAGRLAFCAAAYLLSFRDAADELWMWGTLEAPLLGVIVPALVLAGVALAVGLRRAEVEPLARGEAMLVAAAALAFLLGSRLERGTAVVLVANLVLAFLATGRIVRGLTAFARGPFWEGVGLAGLLLVSRLLELAAPPWLQGLTFLGGGVGVVAAGIAFERRRRAEAELA